MTRHPVKLSPLRGKPIEIASKSLVNGGQKIAIHCKGGSGRTGLIAAQLLIECGIPMREAVAQVQALRPRAIQHPAHINYINQFDKKSPNAR